jgi:fructan beta-fructosidase
MDHKLKDIKPMRPLYHFTSPQNFMNDPNGLVYFDGEYHLFYQHNPFGNTWGHMSWGHAVSPDGLTWQHLPVALYEEDGVMIFSGSAVVDWKNTSAFGDGRIPPLIVIYTGHSNVQTQNIAFSLDRGRSWKKFTGNAVIDISSDNFRDPKVFWHALTNRWIMVVALAVDKCVSIYTSPDLKTWAHASDCGPFGLTECQCWECPDLFELPVEDEAGTHWALKVDAGPGWYIVGNFDGTNFTATQAPRRLDFGPDFYACQSWSDLPNDQHRLLGWMVNWAYANVLPTSPWRGVMTIPRELTLRRDGNEFKLMQTPISLERLRCAAFTDQGVVSGERTLPIKAERMEILAEFEPGTALEFGLRLRVGSGEYTTVGVDMAARQVFVDRRSAGDASFSDSFPQVCTAFLVFDPGIVKLHILVDSCSVEVFVGDGESVLTNLIFPAESSQGVFLYAKDGEAKLRSLHIWPLAEALSKPGVA